MCIPFSAPLTSNEEEEDRSEKVEKGTKVKRTLSSLRNRVTGSFNKDKVNLYHRDMVHNVTLQWNIWTDYHSQIPNPEV